MKNKVTILFLVLVMLIGVSIPSAFGLETHPAESEKEQSVDYDRVAPTLDPVMGKMSVKSNSAEDEGTEGIVTDKTAFPNGDGTYTVRLEAYTTGKVAMQTLNIPSDIVLVLDQSGSMSECMECGQEMDGTGEHTHYKATFQVNTSEASGTYFIKSGGYRNVFYCSECDGWFRTQRHSSLNHTSRSMYLPKTSETDTNANHVQFYISEECISRKTALTKALNAFVGEVCQKAAGEDGNLSTTDDNVNHRIAMVGFANEGGYNYNNTELFIGSNHYTYGTSARAKYRDAFRDMDTSGGQSNVNASIRQLDADGATYVNLGMEMAGGILRENPVLNGQQRNRVVVVFTDGAPGYNGTYGINPVYGSSGDAALVASRALTQGNDIKNNYGATVYTVGIFYGADGTSSGNQNGTNSEKANWFMQQLSSNNGIPQDPGYYLSASDSDTLTNIFKQISQQICTPDIELGVNTKVLDKVSPYFTAPVDTEDIDIYTAAYNGSQFGEKELSNLEATFQEDGTICVSGFDFNENFVTTTPKDDGTYGKKLIIEFIVEPKQGFLGGNGVPTNDDNAGIYAEDGTLVEPFSKPKVDVPIKDVSVEVGDKNVYLFGSLNAQQLKEGLTIEAGAGTDAVHIDCDKENFGLERWQNEFVDISVSLEQDKYNSLDEDTEYTATCKVWPKSGTGGKVDAAVGKINVFMPQLTFKDSTKYYGDEIDENFTENIVKTQWIHNNAVSTDVNMYGEPPALNLIYEEDSGTIQDGKVNTKKDFGVSVKGKIGSKDISPYAAFIHENCEEDEAVPEGKAFLIHVKTCKLTISKTGGDPQEPYIFVIKKGEDIYTEGTIVGNGSLTIHQLPVGSYTVTEEQTWSWRYEPSFEDDDTVNLTCDNPADYVICRNRRVKEKWLNGYSDVIVNIFGIESQDMNA